MGGFLQLGVLACLLLSAESKKLRWRAITPNWVPPRETIAAMDMERLGFSPKPTSAPDPAIAELKLAKRVRGDDTCGYVSGVSTDSIYCQTGSCVVNSFYSVAGCCGASAVTDCKIATACLPATSSRFYSSADTLMRFCSSSAQPECITYVYTGLVFSQYTLYDCATSEARVMVYAIATDSPGDVTSTPDFNEETGTAATPVLTGASTTSTTGLPAPTTTSPVPAPVSSTPVGAIVGGVVGGVAAIAVIVFGIIFLVRKKSQNPNSNATASNATYNGPPLTQGQDPQQPPMYPIPPMQQQQQQQQQPSPGGYGPAPGVYPSGFTSVDNRQSMLKQPYVVMTTGSYEQSSISPPESPPPMSPPPISPSPTHQSGIPAYISPQDQNGNGSSPPPQQQQGGYYNVPPPQQHQHTNTTTTTHHHQSFTSELPATRGDGELRELA